MVFSLIELKKLANLKKNIKVEEIVQAMTSLGFEVESYSKFLDIEGIKFGKIKSITQNPQADGLKVCEIQFHDKKRTIQTTATNVFENMIIAAFVPGSHVNKTIYDKKELKGIISEGMLSNISEFGINKELLRKKLVDGIYAYKNVNINDDPIQVLGLDDYLINVNILSNRSDAASYYIMAKELSAYFKTNIILPSTKKANINTQIEVTKGLAKHLSFIAAKNDFEISLYEQIFLAKHNIKSINNATDLTNLTLLYSGLPIHVYDQDQMNSNFGAYLESGNVNILGNKKVVLDNNLVIKNGKEIVSIASVIGLEKYKVHSHTNNLIFELGIFPLQEVRKTAKLIKISNNSTINGSKNIGVGSLLLAIKYLSNHLNSFSKPINLHFPEKKIIDFSNEKLNLIAGKDIINEDQFKKSIEALKILGFEFLNNKIKVPLYRHDVLTQQDINEEIFRFYGYKNFKIKNKNHKISNIKNDLPFKNQIQAFGYQEVITKILVSKDKNNINPFDFQDIIELKTFNSNEYNSIRNSQITSLLKIAIHNYKKGFKDINIFSQGVINNSYETIALLSTTKSFHEIKTEVANLIPNATFIRSHLNGLHPNICANIIINNKKIGFIGKINPHFSNLNIITAEFLVNDYLENKIFKNYDKNQLKSEDINIILEKREDLDTKLAKFKNIHSIKIIDEYQEENRLKVTIRILK